MASSIKTPADSEFELDISLVASGMEASGFESEDCTSDNCTATNDSAGTTC